MKEEFDLNKVKKQMPYQVPPGFFGDITQATLQEAKRREAAPVKATPIFDWHIWTVAASIAVLLVAGYFLLKGPQPTQPSIAKIQVKHAPAIMQDTNAVFEPMPVPKAHEMPETVSSVRMAKAKVTRQENRPATIQDRKAEKPESLENLLATLTDEEVKELAAIADTESYDDEETLQ